MQYAQMAYDLDRKIGNELGIARRLSQMGDAYFFQKDFKQAEKLYLRANEMLTKIGELNSLSINCKQLGELYFELNKNDQAVEWFLRADKLCAETGNRTIRVTVNEQISWVLKDSDPERSRKFLLYAKNLKDSIQTDKSLIYSSEYKAIFDAQEKEEQLQQQHQQRIVTICIALAVVLLLTLGIILARRHQKKEKSNNAKNSHETTSGENDSEGNETEATETLDNVLEPSALTLKEYDEEQKKFLLAIMDFVNKNISNNMLSVEDVASHMCMSRSQLNRRVNNLLGGKSIVALINATRMEKACRLLKSTNKPINEICMECGYNDHSYFNRVFRATFDMTPKQYRNMPEL